MPLGGGELMARWWAVAETGRADGRDRQQARRRAQRQGEEAFLQQILTLARLCHWACYHTRDSRRSDAGWPDLVLCKPPRLLIRELKRDGEVPTAAQQAWLRALRACGVDAAVWRPADWEAIARSLQET
jgi:hypothetical protein